MGSFATTKSKNAGSHKLIGRRFITGRNEKRRVLQKAHWVLEMGPHHAPRNPSRPRESQAPNGKRESRRRRIAIIIAFTKRRKQVEQVEIPQEAFLGVVESDP